MPTLSLQQFNPQDFLRDIWQQRPCVLRQALPNFSDPISPEQLAGLACDELLESRLILEQGGDYPWQLKHGPFDEADFTSLGDQHWTLLVQDVDKYLPAVAALLAPFRFLPDWRIDDVMVSYAVPGGNVGAHLDNYDVFLIQGQGQRHWRVAQQPSVNESLVPHCDLRLLTQFPTPAQDYVLNPGDILYIPPRFAHHGIAQTACLTYSVGFRAPTAEELADHLLAQSAAQQPRFSDPARPTCQHPGLITPEDLTQLVQLLQQQLMQPAALASYFTQPKDPDALIPHEPALTLAQFKQSLTQSEQIQLHPQTRLAYIKQDQDYLLFIGEHQTPLAASLQGEVDSLITQRQLACATLLGANDAWLELLTHWVNQGYLLID